MMRQVRTGSVRLFPRREMVDLVLVDGAARGVVVRNLINGQLEAYAADAVILATGGYSNVFFLSTNAVSCNISAIWKAHRKGAFFANPCFTQTHPTCIPVSGHYQSKLTLMSESLRNDGRVWVPRKAGDRRGPSEIPDNERCYLLEEKYPTFGNLVPRDVASRGVKEACDAGRGVGESGFAVYLDLREAVERDGEDTIRDRYGNVFSMYEKITGENPYEVPMRIYPAPHYTMGGLWVDYDLMSTIPGLFVLGEANFSDHGANRLGASALMQTLADGYFIIPYTLGGYFAGRELGKPDTSHPAFREAMSDARQRTGKLMAVNGHRTAADFHRQMGMLMWDACGMSRSEAGLKEALKRIPQIREEFWDNVAVAGSPEGFNQNFEHAGRVADFLEFAELMALDALNRKESCGGHFRVESQTESSEPLRDDADFCHVAAWEFTGAGKEPILHKEPLEFENAKLAERTYR
jgi:succinate dehydrogenase / fumarate reductase flavoprotein subunit